MERFHWIVCSASLFLGTFVTHFMWFALCLTFSPTILSFLLLHYWCIKVFIQLLGPLCPLLFILPVLPVDIVSFAVIISQLLHRKPEDLTWRLAFTALESVL